MVDEDDDEFTVLDASDTKVHLYRTYILPVLLYGCETWTVTKTHTKTH